MQARSFSREMFDYCYGAPDSEPAVRRIYRLCFKYRKNSPSVDRMSVVSGAKVFR
jgi:hypothetical protein